MSKKKATPKKESMKLFAIVVVHNGLIESVTLRRSMNTARNFVAKQFHLPAADKKTVDRALDELNTSGKWEVRIIASELPR